MFSASRGTNSGPGPTRPSAKPLASSLLSDIDEALHVIRNNHIDSPAQTGTAVVGSSVNEMLRTLDPHSRFYSREEFAELLGDHHNEYFGTGISIAEYSAEGRKGVFIIGITAGTSAARAGLRFGDRIVAVGDRSVERYSSSEVRELIRGPLGTRVRLSIERHGEAVQRIVELERTRISQPGIGDAFLVEGNVGYIALDKGFGFTTAAEFSEALHDLKNAGAESLIVDLRGNGGGLFEQAVEIAEIFLPSGARLVSQETRGGSAQVWTSANPKPEMMPLIILIDAETASASEVLAGAMQDNDRALMVGERSFGKGLVQNVIELPGSAGMTLTSARYYTPAGRSIQRDYSDTGLYDYFKHTEKGSTIGDAAAAVRTVTNRPVFGGNGIEPDISLKQGGRRDTTLPSSLFDAAFFAVRELTPAQLMDLRQRAIHSGDLADDPIAATLAEKIDRRQPGRHPSDAVRTALRYTLTLAVFDLAAAERLSIASDPTIAAAIKALPISSELAKAARRFTEKQKKAR